MIDREKIEVAAREAAAVFTWAGIVNRLRTMTTAYRLGFLKGYEYNARFGAGATELQSGSGYDFRDTFAYRDQMEGKIAEMSAQISRLNDALDTALTLCYVPEHAQDEHWYEKLKQCESVSESLKKGKL